MNFGDLGKGLKKATQPCRSGRFKIETSNKNFLLRPGFELRVFRFVLERLNHLTIGACNY